MNAEIASKGIFALGLAAVAAVTVSSYTRKSVEPEIVTPAKAAALTPPPESPAQFRARAIDNIKLRTTPQWSLYRRDAFWNSNFGQYPLFNTGMKCLCNPRFILVMMI